MSANLTPNGRLLQLARTLRNVVPMERFALDAWAFEVEGGCGETSHSYNVQTLVDDTDGECGFAGCACGWAATDPVLVAEGFPEPGALASMGWDTVYQFFDLHPDDAHSLFTRDGWADWYNTARPVYGVRSSEVSYDYHPTPAEVADHIEWFVAQNPDGHYYKD